MTHSALVSTGWVEDALGDPAVQVIEVDEDTTAYSRGHLPGSVVWHWRDDLAHTERRDMCDAAQLAALLGRSGAGPDTTAVLYGGNANLVAAYAYWTLRCRGFDNVRLMDGGRRKWELEGRPMTRAVPPDNHVHHPPPRRERPELRADRDRVLAALEAPRVLIVDARAPAEFTGHMLAPPHLPDEQARMPGHIPGAINVPWFQCAAEDGAFRDPDRLRELFDDAGVTPEGECIVYGRIGERGAHTWFALAEVIGYPNVRHYDGAWLEYGNLIGAPVAR